MKKARRLSLEKKANAIELGEIMQAIERMTRRHIIEGHPLSEAQTRLSLPMAKRLLGIVLCLDSEKK
jgi:hypothetical protein